MFSPEGVNKLIAIHKDVLSRFVYVTDKENFGVIERWSIIPDHMLSLGTIRGDCDDFARVCMLKARQHDFYARLVYCLVSGEGHLICEVADSMLSQAFFFDNRQSRLATYDDVKDYEFRSVSPWNPIKGDTRAWLRVDAEALKSLRKNIA